MPEFSENFRQDLMTLMRWRRDLRRFRSDPVEDALLKACLAGFDLAPSVGLSQPWRLIRVDSPAARAAALDNFQTVNADAMAGYAGDRAQRYAGLKLTGMQEAPIQLAIFCDDTTEKGAGLGAATMPEMRRYSVVAAIAQMWLIARAHGLGLGWVSILDPARLARDLKAPRGWHLVAYLCLGWPKDDRDVPELEQAGWESRARTMDVLRR